MPLAAALARHAQGFAGLAVTAPYFLRIVSYMLAAGLLGGASATMCSLAKILRVAVALAATGIAFPALAQSTKFVQMPGGGSCFITDTGFVFGCTENAARKQQDQHALQNAYRQGAQAEHQYQEQQKRVSQMQYQAAIQRQQEDAVQQQEYAREHQANEAMGTLVTRQGEEKRERDGTTSICKTKLADGSTSYSYCKPGSSNDSGIH